REWSVVALVVLALACVIGLQVFRKGLGWSARTDSPKRLRIAALRASMLEFSAGNPMRLWRAFAVDMTFHVFAVFEAYITLRWLLGTLAPTLTEALLFEVLNRVITVAFKFAPLLAVSSTAGVALAVIRKVRNLFWNGIGLALIAVSHAREAPMTDRHGTAPAHRT